MAEDLINASVKLMVKKLISVLAEEISLAWGVKKERRVLEESFKAVEAFLHDASGRQVEEEHVNLWLKKLENVSYEADHLLDEFHYTKLRRKVLTRNQMRRKVRFFFSSNNPLIFRLNMAHKIKNVNTKLKKINKEASRHGIRTIIAESDIYLPPVIETSSKTADPIFLGRENDVSKLVHMLVTPSNEVVSFVSIVGMGGLGKTTLARTIYNDTRTVRNFDQRIWVFAYEKLDTLALLKRILEELTTSDVNIKSKEEAMKMLQEKLKNSRYLLVLDDVWHEQQIFWEDFKSSLLGINRNKGNFCIVTTRRQDVASIVSPMAVFPLDKLSNDDCWSIIKERAFSGVDVPNDLEIIGNDIASRCGGLPLSANIVGATLQGKEYDDWTSFLDSGFSASNGEERAVLQVLKVSFDRLASPLIKKCFAYCSIFPKNARIYKEQLIELWMGEGFLIENDGNDMENIGSRVYNILLQNYFLQKEVKDEFGNIIHSKMHDFVHDLACLVSKAESFSVKNSTANSENNIPLKLDI